MNRAKAAIIAETAPCVRNVSVVVMLWNTLQLRLKWPASQGCLNDEEYTNYWTCVVNDKSMETALAAHGHGFSWFHLFQKESFAAMCWT